MRTFTRFSFPTRQNTSIREYPVLPGICVCLNRMNTTSMPLYPGNREGLIIINYGLRGRSEQTLADGNLTFVAAGDLAISFQSVQKNFCFPSGIYEGIEFYIDPGKNQAVRTTTDDYAAVAATQGVNIADLGLDLSQLKTRFGRTGFYKSNHLPAIDRLMRAIWATKGDDSAEEFATVCISTLEILRILLFEDIPEVRYTNLSPANAACAQQYKEALTHDLSIRITAKEFAARLGISETSLKNYFRSVYGENVSDFMRRYRMEAARELLTESSRTIGQIAGEVGFAGQNKFSSAFRSFYGCSPGEYRAQCRKAKEISLAPQDQ